jgi:hypothetical protein
MGGDVMAKFYVNPSSGPEVSFSGSKKKALPKASKFFRRMKNVAAGFYDEDGIFHPIRASYDYSRKRVGERPKRKSKKRRKR